MDVCGVNRPGNFKPRMDREQLLTQHAAHPLPQIWELIMSDVKHNGVQQDDQSLFLLRTLL
jgi:hypothetical protein